MLHLAQIQKTDVDGKAQLQLLAQQKSEYAWDVIAGENVVILADAIDYSEGALVLVDLAPNRQIQQIYDARAWVLDIVEQYLTSGLSPAGLQEEVQRAEQWRQSLTLQSQELGRRSLEMEARRDQIQELEEKLKREKIQLEMMATQLKSKSNNSSN